MIYHVHACALIVGLLVLPIFNAVFMLIARRMHQEECSYTSTTSTSDDRTWDILNRMAEYEDIPDEEPTVIEVPNLAENNERPVIKEAEQ